MIVIAFRSRLRPGCDMQELMKHGARMYELASGMPGFVSYKDFAAADGEGLAFVEFETLESLHAWRMHPEHVFVQKRAREVFFSEYRIQVCDTVRDYAFKLPG